MSIVGPAERVRRIEARCIDAWEHFDITLSERTFLEAIRTRWALRTNEDALLESIEAKAFGGPEAA